MWCGGSLVKCEPVIQSHQKGFLLRRISGQTTSLKVTWQVCFPWGILMIGGGEKYFLCYIFLFPFKPHSQLCFSYQILNLDKSYP
jgi:hypothetical protein